MDKKSGVTEAAAGILAYLHKEENPIKISAKIKERFSDFVVNEISLSGEVCNLTTKEIPKILEATTQQGKTSEEDPLKLDKKSLEALFLEGLKSLSLISEESSSQLRDVLIAKQLLTVNEETDSKKTFDFVEFKSTSDKETRTKIHKIIRKNFHGYLVSDTKEQKVRVFLKGASQGTKRANNLDSRSIYDRKRKKQKRGDRTFIQFTLKKINCDTGFVTNKLNKSMNYNKNKKFQSRSCVTIAGTKDKRGITTQFITVNKPYTSQNMNTIKKSLSSDYVKVGNFKEVKSMLKLGDLSGNQFEIVLRDIAAEPKIGNAKLKSVVQGRMKMIKDRGFVNYFGLQRFGVRSSLPTHELGKMLLAKEYAKLISSLLKPSENDVDRVLEAKNYMEPFLGFLGSKIIVDELEKPETELDNFEKAFKTIPAKMVAEKAIIKSFLKQIKDEKRKKVSLRLVILGIPYHLRLLYTHALQSFIWNQVTTLRVNKYKNQNIQGDLLLVNNIPEISSDVDQEKNSFVLPLPGFDVKYPENEFGKEMYEAVMKEHFPDTQGLKLFETTDKEFAVSGSYRECISKVTGLSYEFGITEKDQDGFVVETADTEYNSLQIKFVLEKSSYATMLIRELTRVGTDLKSRSGEK
eukprot:maker-scaffold_3-snap-gene-15.30-mRNA-1 protein AED:0.00 eAED:0.00 QI:28/1/1/1/1/1/2/204/633